MDTTANLIGAQTRPGGRPRARLFGQSGDGGGSIMRSVLLRHFDGAQVATALTTVDLAFNMYHYASNAIRAVWNWVIRHCVVTVEITYSSELKQSVLTYVGDKVLARRHPTELMAHVTQRKPGDLDFEKFENSGSGVSRPRAWRFVPKLRSVWFFHRRWLLMIKSSSVTTCDESINDYADIHEDLTIVCLGVSSEPIADFLDTCRELYDKKRETYITTFANSGGHWNHKQSKIPRPLSSVHLVESVKEELVNDIRSYLDVKTQRRYDLRNIPYRRGYLFYGPPGTGKTTLSEAIAGVFQLNIYAIDLSSVVSDKDLARLFQALPQRCIVLLEDIDVAGLVRNKDTKVIAASSILSNPPPPPPPFPTYSDNAVLAAAPMPPDQTPLFPPPPIFSRSKPRATGCTLSGVLQALDGVGSQEGRIVIMTTNRPEDLDDALIRPGRVDKKVRLGHADRDCARDMFIRMFEPNIATNNNDNGATGQLKLLLEEPPTCCDMCPTLDMAKIRALADQFALQVPEDMFSPGQLQGFFQMHLECPQSALAQIAAWIEQEKRPQFEETVLNICVRSSDGGLEDMWYRLKPKDTLDAMFDAVEHRVMSGDSQHKMRLTYKESQVHRSDTPETVSKSRS
ncbi:mitochondrial chaperone bcs1 [Apiospora saccharicola]|uniref:Mitochondrial chaperone bcs1 n=1 Tax=Apiospora saccharicola TaxID=335842 RepID=A0ABR1UPH6_9PEZI